MHRIILNMHKMTFINGTPYRIVREVKTVSFALTAIILNSKLSLD